MPYCFRSQGFSIFRAIFAFRGIYPWQSSWHTVDFTTATRGEPRSARKHTRMSFRDAQILASGNLLFFGVTNDSASFTTVTITNNNAGDAVQLDDVYYEFFAVGSPAATYWGSRCPVCCSGLGRGLLHAASKTIGSRVSEIAPSLR